MSLLQVLQRVDGDAAFRSALGAWFGTGFDREGLSQDTSCIGAAMATEERTLSPYLEIEYRRQAAVAAAYQQFARELQQLQESCAHAEVTNWLPGYITATRNCKRCWKVMEVNPNGGVAVLDVRRY